MPFLQSPLSSEVITSSSAAELSVSSSSLNETFTNNQIDELTAQLDDCLFHSNFDHLSYCTNIIESSQQNNNSSLLILPLLQSAYEMYNWLLVQECTSNSTKLLNFFTQDQLIKESLTSIKETIFEFVNQLDEESREEEKRQQQFQFLLTELNLKEEKIQQLSKVKRMKELKQQIIICTSVDTCCSSYLELDELNDSLPIELRISLERERELVLEIILNSIKQNLGQSNFEQLSKALNQLGNKENLIVEQNNQISNITEIENENIIRFCLYNLVLEQEFSVELMENICNNLILIHRDFSQLLSFVLLKELINGDIFDNILYESLVSQSLNEFVESFGKIHQMYNQFYIKESEIDHQYLTKLDSIANLKFIDLICSFKLEECSKMLELFDSFKIILPIKEYLDLNKFSELTVSEFSFNF